ncbi:Fc.00g069150.m01.CDS01 [Cosmosporella sp. VM-42]
MPVEVSLNTPLADALNTAIQPKLVEVGWGTGGADDSALAEYIILMLVNGKTQDQIAAELSGELLNLGPDDPGARDFSKWLFDQIEVLNTQINGGPVSGGDSMAEVGDDDITAGEMDTDMNAGDSTELNAPTGPRSMRNGNPRGGGREKRMFGHMNKAMDRTGDSALHRVRGSTGNERINTHGRTPPTGPRTGQGRLPRNNNNRAANIQAGLAGMAAGGPQAQPWMMQGGQPNQMELMAMLEQQNQMMFQLSQQLMTGSPGHNGGFGQQRRGGKSLFDRVQDPNKNNFRRGQNNANKPDSAKAESTGEAGDVDMSGEPRDPPNSDEMVCKYNLKCTNRECKFAHQSPAAPPGATVDVNDTCSFGAACKNRKCVGRHPSPAARLAHQSEQDCKFFPNCQNPRCPFKHPSMPLCRNGADCTTTNCKFTHVRTKCKFNPCLNPHCAFAHEEGQQGGFKDKVWTAEGGEEHVSERKFVDDQAAEELIKPEDEAMKQEQAAQDTEVIG